MRDKTPDQPAPEHEPTENQPQPTEDAQAGDAASNVAAASPHSGAPASVKDAPRTDAPAEGETAAQPAPDARLRQDQDILQAREIPTQGDEAEAFATPDSMAVDPDGPLIGTDASDGLKTPPPLLQETLAPELEFKLEPEAKSETAPAVEDGPTPCNFFKALSWGTPLVLALLAVLLFAPLAHNSKITGIDPQPGRSPQLVAALAQANQAGDLSFWIIPHIAGQPTADVLPMQLWWAAVTDAVAQQLSGLAGAWIGGWTGPLLLGWLFIMAVACLGWTDSRHKHHAGLAAGLAAFCGLPFIGAAWFASDLLLAPTLSILSAACLLRGLKKATFSLTTFAGCVFMALAALSGGLLPAALPLCAVLFAIIGTLNFRRLGEWDLVFGLGLTLLILGGWLTSGLLFAGSTALRAYLGSLPLLTGGGYALPALPQTCLLTLLAATLLPWAALPVLMPVRSGKALLAGVKSWKNRTGFTEPLFLTGLLLTGLAGLLVTSPAHPAVFLMLAASIAALASRSLTNLSISQNRRWGLFCAAYLLILSAGFLWLLLDNGREMLNAHLGIAPNISFGVKTWLAPAAVAIVGAITMWFFGRDKSSQGGLLAFTLAMLLLSQAFAWVSLPVIQPYVKASNVELPSQDIVLPMPDALPDGPRLHLPMPPAPPVITPVVTPAAHNATQTPPAQPDILGAPMPALRNATIPATEAPEATPPAQNATLPVPDAGDARYGDDLPALTPPPGPPPAPYQPGLHTQEPPLPMLDTPLTAPAPLPRVDPYPPQRDGNTSP